MHILLQAKSYVQEQGHVVLIGTEEGRMHRYSTAVIDEAQITSTARMDPVYCRHQMEFMQASTIRHKLAHSLQAQFLCAGTRACRADRYRGGAHAQMQHSLVR